MKKEDIELIDLNNNYLQKLRNFKNFINKPVNTLFQDEGEEFIIQLNKMLKKIETYPPDTQVKIKEVIDQCDSLSKQEKLLDVYMEKLNNSFNALGISPEPDCKLLSQLGKGLLYAIGAAAIITAIVCAIAFAPHTGGASLFGCIGVCCFIMDCIQPTASKTSKYKNDLLDMKETAIEMQALNITETPVSPTDTANPDEDEPEADTSVSFK